MIYSLIAGLTHLLRRFLDLTPGEIQMLSALSQKDSQAIVQVANERRRLAAGETDTQALEATATLNDSDMQRRIAEHERQVRATFGKAVQEAECKREQKQAEQQVHKQKRSARIAISGEPDNKAPRISRASF